MNRIIRLFSIITIVTVLSCSSSKENKETASEAVETEVRSETPTDTNPLNPNLSSEDELLTIDLIDKEVASLIIENRPYLSFSEFDSLLSTSFSGEELTEVRKVVFLPINLNLAAEEDFKKVPGVGDKMAHEFEEYRPYVSIKQFRREIGKYVSETEVAEYEKYVYVPLNLNEASEEEVLSIPGVGKKMAHEFEEYRPYQSIDHFRREIGKYVDDEELKRLERYITL